MAKPVFYKVRAIAGRLVQHPSSVGTGSIHVIGHEKYDDPTDLRYPLGKPVPTTRFKLADGDARVEVVKETDDGYFAEKIRHGDVEYLATCEGPDADARTWVEPVLMRRSRDAIAADQRRADEDARAHAATSATIEAEQARQLAELAEEAAAKPPATPPPGDAPPTATPATATAPTVPQVTETHTAKPPATHDPDAQVDPT